MDNRKLIPVTGDEAITIAAAEQVERTAVQRVRENTTKGLVDPFIPYETERERAIIGAAFQLQCKYKDMLQLDCLPTLYPIDNVNGQIKPTHLHQQDPVYYSSRRAPTDMDLCQLMLKRVILRRKGETVYQYNNYYYERLSTDRFHTLIVGTLRNELSINGQAKQIKNVATAILSEPDIEVETTPINPAFLCLRDGVLDLRTLQLGCFSPDYFFTYQLQVDWYGNPSCPQFDCFISAITNGDTTLTQRFWEAIGYVLAPGNQAKRFLLLQGHGDTGKSVFGKIISSFFEPQAVGSVDMFRMGDRFSLSGLADKQVNISMDLSSSSLSEQTVSIIKQITGGDLLQVEEKYKAPYATYLSCKLIFGTNHAIRLHSSDAAFIRRILLLPFQFPIPKHQQDPNLYEKLLFEKCGIFKKAIAAYKVLVSKNFQFAGDDTYTLFDNCATSGACTNPLGSMELFISTCCRNDPDAFIPTDTLFNAYSTFCHTNGYIAISNKQAFSASFNKAIASAYPHVLRLKQRVNGVPTNGYRGVSVAFNSAREE